LSTKKSLTFLALFFFVFGNYWLQVCYICINKVVGGLATSLGFRVICLAKMISGACKKLKKKDVNYGSHDMTYWTMVMKLPRFGIQPKKLVEMGIYHLMRL
jgi:hypothetical protein